MDTNIVSFARSKKIGTSAKKKSARPRMEREVNEAMSRLCVPVMTQTVYIKTRKNAQGKREFASYRGWTTDIRQAQVVNYNPSNEGIASPWNGAEGGQIKRVSMAVYNSQAFNPAQSPDARIDPVVIARQVEMKDWVQTAGPVTGIVTGGDRIGQDPVVSHDLWRDAASASTITSPGQVMKNVRVPTHTVKGIIIKQEQIASPGIRVMTFCPA
jgi:hypothetical protein